MKIAVSTDTSCTISKELAAKLDIKVFPLNVIVDGVEYLDGVSIDQQKLYEDMKKNKNIKTSTPPPGSIIEYFENLFKEGYDKIIHFTISSKLSSMNNLFNNISNEYFDGKVIVIDAYSVSAPMLTHVLYAYEGLKRGLDPEQIKQDIEERKNDFVISFIPENLTALKNGGRVSPVVAALGNLIGLKPILFLKDGELSKNSMARNVKKEMTKQIEEFSKTYTIDDYDVAICSFYGNEAIIDNMKNEIQKHFNFDPKVLPIAINVCAHAGPGTIGLLITKKIFGKSLYEYLD